MDAGSPGLPSEVALLCGWALTGTKRNVNLPVLDAKTAIHYFIDISITHARFKNAIWMFLLEEPDGGRHRKV